MCKLVGALAMDRRCDLGAGWVPFSICDWPDNCREVFTVDLYDVSRAKSISLARDGAEFLRAISSH